MNKWLMALGILFVAQLALAAVLHLNTKDYSAYQAQAVLLDFDIDQIDRFEISTAETRLILAKNDNKWLLPEHDNATVKLDQIEAMLNKLSVLKKGWPVAKTASAARRFKVDEDLFERKLVLYQGDKQIGELLIGTSPALRQSHVRKPDESEIYNVKFDAWQASTKHEDWVEPPPEEKDAEKEAS